MRLLGNIRISRTLRRLRSRSRPGVAILGYHRVAEGVSDPLGLSISPARFAEQLAVIARRAKPLRLVDAATAVASGRIPSRAVVVTFDDGYADNLHTVLPLLERYDIPATTFVTSGNRGGEYWWDRLARVGTAAGDDVERLAVELERLSDRERSERLDLLEAAGGSSAGGVVHRTLTEAELQTLAANPLIEVGAHSVSHPALPTLTADRQRDEVSGCRSELESLLGRPVRSFAYPHGALTEQTMAIVGEAGYSVACGSKYDVAASGAPSLALPRLWVADHDGPRFESWLRGWLHGL